MERLKTTLAWSIMSGLACTEKAPRGLVSSRPLSLEARAAAGPLMGRPSGSPPPADMSAGTGCTTG